MDCTPLVPIKPHKTYQDVSNGLGGWLTQKFINLLPEEVMDSILGIVSARENVGPDRLAWGISQDGKFSTKSAYNLIVSPPSSNNNLWKLIWKLDVPQRICCY
ncbi:ribonuclease H [Sesbania bispinosa]|nr:ribonuclease H [Sesbania bispinosa]